MFAMFRTLFEAGIDVGVDQVLVVLAYVVCGPYTSSSNNSFFAPASTTSLCSWQLMVWPAA